MSNKILMAFDFDGTVIDENSDTYVMRLSPGGELPADIKALFKRDSWTTFMGTVFRFLHDNQVTVEQYRECIKDIELVPGMAELLTYITGNGDIDAIIISDSNSFFIEELLQVHGFSDGTFDKVFTNPAHFDSNGCLHVTPYHHQTWCSISTVNMCKGYILREYAKSRNDTGVVYKHVMYIGDGTNDVCPSRTLRPVVDFACPRKDYSFWNAMFRGESDEPSSLGIQAEILAWESGLELLERVKLLYNT